MNCVKVDYMYMYTAMLSCIIEPLDSAKRNTALKCIVEHTAAVPQVQISF